MPSQPRPDPDPDRVAPRPGIAAAVSWPFGGSALGGPLAKAWPLPIALPRLAAAAACFVAIYFYVYAFRFTYIDDAYIQLRYARTLLDSGTWGFYPGHPANTATSPLNVLVLAALGIPGNSVTAAVVWSTALELAALLWLLLRLSRLLFGGAFFGWFAFVALATNLLLLSTVGMESILYLLLLVAAVVGFVERRWPAMAVALGLLTLARPDGVLLLAVLLTLAETTARRKLAMLAIWAGTIAPWFLFSWVALGSFVPDTLVIKLGDDAWGASNFADGLALYLDRYRFETAASLLLAPLCVFPVWRCGRETVKVVAVLGLYGALHYVLYSALAVPPYHWYFVHQLGPMLLIASVAVAYHVARLERARLAGLARAVVLVPALGLLVLAWDEGFPLVEAPINTNWATGRQYKGVGLWMREHLRSSTAVAVRGEIGTVAFFANNYLVNEFSDISIADALIEEAGYDEQPLVGPLLAVNFFWRRDHAPLPAPTYEFAHVEQPHGLARCVPEDPACVMVRDGTTEWVGRNWLLVRRIG